MERDLCDNLVGSAIEKALVGVPVPVVHRGRLVYEPARDETTGKIIRDPETGRAVSSNKPMMIYKKSERLHLILLQLKMPELFGKKSKRTGRSKYRG